MNHCNGEHKNLETNEQCAFIITKKWVVICGGCYNGSRYKNKNDFRKVIK